MKRLILASIAMVVGLMTPWSAVAYHGQRRHMCQLNDYLEGQGNDEF